MKKLIIIPAYNESESIEKTVRDIIENAPSFDYVVINDCSTDNTRQICEDNGFNIVNLPVNLGIGGAVQTGYLYAERYGYDIAVQVDGDGQHDAKFLGEMADYLEKNDLDMVIGSRFIEKQGFQSSKARRIGINYFTGLIKLCTGQKITDPTSGLRLIGRRTIVQFAKKYPKDYPEPETVVAILTNIGPNGNRITVVAILKKGFKVAEIPVVMRERQGGSSSITLKKSVYYMVKVTLAILFENFRGDKHR